MYRSFLRTDCELSTVHSMALSPKHHRAIRKVFSNNRIWLAGITKRVQSNLASSEDRSRRWPHRRWSMPYVHTRGKTRRCSHGRSEIGYCRRRCVTRRTCQVSAQSTGTFGSTIVYLAQSRGRLGSTIVYSAQSTGWLG